MTRTAKKKIVKRTSKAKPDVYERAVRYLTKNPYRIWDAWVDAGDLGTHSKTGWVLFRNVTPDGVSRRPEGNFGCLTQVKSGTNRAFTQELTEAIRSDAGLDGSPCKITVKSLPVYAAWQRRLDKEFGRKAPV
jgi:hypothetical protein